MLALARRVLNNLQGQNSPTNICWPIESDIEHISFAKKVLEDRLTMTSASRVRATLQSCEYVIQADIPGDFVECGVWRGGHGILARQIFDNCGSSKQVWMFDTFSGMTPPSPEDSDLKGTSDPVKIFTEKKINENSSDWCFASIDEVRGNVVSAVGSLSGTNLIEGDVSKTLNQAEHIPDLISILRLDTDWYSSTKLELEVLYPRLVKGGVLIIDDYGKWSGSKTAVDDFFKSLEISPFPFYIDSSSRMFVKS